ncbi:MAG: serine/threonine protein kinase [Thermoguttaceae bacterium]|nr:serine/threonine protein kinase [Thermoguttaceae bacterium]MDW8036756.1 serine/threonine-protein kinase [Thermoguttaceae bacterium]
MASSPPEIPNYQLLSLIAQRPTCQVWLAQDRPLGRYCAIKIIPRAAEPSSEDDQAQRELKALRALQQRIGHSHPHLITIYQAAVTSEYLYYVMELADDLSGTFPSNPQLYRPASLANRLAKQILRPEDCVRYAQQLLQGLSELHRLGIVHRDVKPSNCVFVGGVLKLADFGFLKPVGKDISLVGTAGYIPPEGVLDETADVYAAGKVIYQMITGLEATQFPWLGPFGSRIGQYPTLALLNQIALQACSPDRFKRFANAILMLQTLEDRLRCLAPSTSSPTVPSPMPVSCPEEQILSSQSSDLFGKNTAPGRWSAVVIPVVALGLLLLVAFWPRSQTPPSEATPQTVSVNFVAGPWEAEILLDGEPILAPDKTPYRTPCTIPDLPAKSYRLGLRLPTGETYELGEVDFSSVREVVLPFPFSQQLPKK